MVVLTITVSALLAEKAWVPHLLLELLLLSVLLSLFLFILFLLPVFHLPLWYPSRSSIDLVPSPGMRETASSWAALALHAVPAWSHSQADVIILAIAEPAAAPMRAKIAPRLLALLLLLLPFLHNLRPILRFLPLPSRIFIFSACRLPLRHPSCSAFLLVPGPGMGKNASFRSAGTLGPIPALLNHGTDMRVLAVADAALTPVRTGMDRLLRPFFCP